jgi:hypothetical protein
MIPLHNKYIVIFLLSLQAHSFAAEQPTTLFCHGIVNDKEQVHLFENFIQEPYLSFNFSDAMPAEDWDLNSFIYQAGLLCNKKINRNNMAMGHGIDITTLYEQINPNKEYILYGLSRGGATIVKYLGEYNPTNVKAIVIDSAPADVVQSVYDFQKNLGLIVSSDRNDLESTFHQLFPAYPINSLSAVNSITNITNKDLPILIVHSQEDTRVHISSAWQMYLQFIQAGFTHVYLCELKQGRHGFITKGNDKDIYLTTLHNFYKKYDFYHYPSFTNNNPLPQPEAEIITLKIASHNQKSDKIYEKKQALLTKMLAGTSFFALVLLYQKYQ